MKRDLTVKASLIWLFFVVSCGLYLYSMPPSFNADDSPETSAAFYTLGVQHPPGYPLNSLCGKIFMGIPVATPAFRANLMAVAFNMLAGLFIFLSLLKIFGGIQGKKKGFEAGLAALSGASFFMFSRSAWLQGVLAKGSIYSMNAFFAALCFFLLVNLDKGKKYFYLFAFCYGMSMGNHWTSMAAIAPAILVYLFLKRRLLDVRMLLYAAVFFILGASVYLFVFIRSTGLPAYAWGEIRTVKDLLWLVSRAQYAAGEKKHAIGDTVNLLKYYVSNFSFSEFPALLGWILIPGSVLLFKRARNEIILAVLAWLLVLLSVVSVATPPENTQWLIKTYLVSSNLFAAVLMAFFVMWALIKSAGAIKKILIAAVAAAILFVLVCDMPAYRRYFVGYDYMQNLRKSFPENAVVFMEGDMNIGASLYATLVEKQKYVPLIPVVLFYDWYTGQVSRNFPAMVNFPPKTNDMKGYIESIVKANSGREIYYSNVFTAQWVAGLRPQPLGVVEKILTDGRPVVITDNPMRIYSFRGLNDGSYRFDEFTRRLVMQNYANSYYSIGDNLRQLGYAPAAAGFYTKGLAFYPADGAYVNLGLCYYSSGNLEGAEKWWKKAVEMNPRSSVAYANLAYVYVSKKDYATAREYLDIAINIDPNNVSARQLLDRLPK
jgi:tetratricopeptide (TPR) repeat protein